MAYFKTACDNSHTDVCFSTHGANPNLHHPIEITNMNLHEVVDEGKVFMHRPNAR